MDDVVDEDHHLAVNFGDSRGGSTGGLAQVAVVAMLARIQHTDRDRRALEAGQLGGQAARKVVTLGEDADEDKAIDSPVALRDLMRDSRKRSPDLVRVHHRRLEPLLGDAHPSRRSRRAMRTWRPLCAWRK